MSKVLVVLFLLVSGDCGVKGRFSFVAPKVYSSKERHFNYIYEQIRSHEGGYVFHENDKGGQTYGGIARRIHPKWQGWYVIDKTPGKKRYQIIQEAEYYVKDWYLDQWIRGGFEVIADRELALNLFDFVIHSSPRTVELKVNRVLEKLGCEKVRVQGEWVDDRFNRVPPREFVLLLKIERIKLFNYLVQKDTSQMVFLKGWYQRIENI